MNSPIDPMQGILINLEEWFKAHPIKEGQTLQGEKIFQSPGSIISFAIIKDPVPAIGKHKHVTTDEIIFVYKGTGELYLNGKWVPLKTGDFHVCPRGTAHATRASAGGELWVIGMYTPPQPKEGDRVMVPY